MTVEEATAVVGGLEAAAKEAVDLAVAGPEREGADLAAGPGAS